MFSSALLISPLLAAVVIVNAGADVRGDLESAAARANRILERLWAIILIQFVQNVLYIFAMNAIGATTGTAFLGALFLGAFLFMVLATLMYADIDAGLAPNRTAIALLPCAIHRSITLASRSFSRALVLLGVQVFAQTLISLADLLLQSQHVTRPDFWSPLILGTVINVLATAYTTVVYLDNLEREAQGAR